MKLENILILDIMTDHFHPNNDDLSEESQQLFTDKTSYSRKKTSTADFYERAGILAGFSKIICLSVGYFTSLQSKPRQVRITSFSQLLKSHFSRPYHRLCAHNGKEFDFPLHLKADDGSWFRIATSTTNCWEKAMGSSSSQYHGALYLMDLMYKNILSLNIGVSLNLSWKYIDHKSVSILDVL